MITLVFVALDPLHGWLGPTRQRALSEEEA
jgi:hypothetical protein